MAKFLCVVGVLIAVTADSAVAQSLRGSIAGAVSAGENKPLAGAKVTLTHEATNRVRHAVCGPEGEFTISLLAPGPYRLEAEHDGYRKHVRHFVLEVNQELRVDIPMVVGRITEEIVVSASRSPIRTESSALGAVIENRQITNLPLNGRNFYELSLLAPGAMPAAQGSAGSVRGAMALNVNGAREDSNQFLLDGIYNGDPKLNTIGVTPPVDAIAEFEVLTSAYDASFGRNVGGQVNVVLKSGSNGFHGTAYEFFRNQRLDARNFFALGQPQYQRNQFGGSIGGPIRKNRTFFFADYEARLAREGITRVSNVPTEAERKGDFSRSALIPIDPFTQQPFPGFVIPPSRMHPTGLAIAALYPLPNRNVPGQNYVSSPTLRDNDHHFDARLDHSLGSRSELTFRYSFGDRDLFEPFSGPGFAAVPGYGTNIPRRDQNVLVGETRTITPSLLNEVRLGYSRAAAGSYHQNQGASLNRQVGLPELSANPRDWGLSFISATGFSPLGDEYNNPQHSVTNSYQVVDQMSWARGRRLVKWGADFRSLRQNAYRDVQSRGFLNFVGLTGNSLAEMLLGYPTVTGGAKLDNHQHPRTESLGLFAQDSWRPHHRLTLTLGLRYEFISPPVDPENRASVYVPSLGQVAQVGSGSVPRAGYVSDKNNWAPRVGLAWMPRNSGSTVIRTGYGLYYDQSALAPGEGIYFNQPYYDFRLYFPLPGLPLTLSDPFPSSFPFPYPPSAFGYDTRLRNAYTQHWNFGVQQQLGRNRVVEVAYAGSKGTRLLSARDINQPYPSAAPINPRPNLRYGDVTLIESRGNSTYNSLQSRFQQRLTGGLSVLAAYTWAKSIDDASAFFPSAGDPNFPQDSRNVRAERGRSNFDARQRLSLSYSYDFPFRSRGRAAWLVNGWQTHGVWTFQAGRPFTVALLPDLDNSNTGRSSLGFGANDRPNRAAKGTLANPSPDLWFDTRAFVIPAFGTFGNSGRNILEGPGLQTINVSVLKDTRFSESLTMQFRAEAFNVGNRANFDLPDLYVGSPTLGRISSAGSPRHVQFGVKLLF